VFYFVYYEVSHVPFSPLQIIHCILLFICQSLNIKPVGRTGQQSTFISKVLLTHYHFWKFWLKLVEIHHSLISKVLLLE